MYIYLFIDSSGKLFPVWKCWDTYVSCDWHKYKKKTFANLLTAQQTAADQKISALDLLESIHAAVDMDIGAGTPSSDEDEESEVSFCEEVVYQWWDENFVDECIIY